MGRRAVAIATSGARNVIVSAKQSCRECRKLALSAHVDHRNRFPPRRGHGQPFGSSAGVLRDLCSLSNDYLESEVAVLSAQLDAAEHRLLTLIRELDRRERHRQVE